jgi:hypothetical protein
MIFVPFTDSLEWLPKPLFVRAWCAIACLCCGRHFEWVGTPPEPSDEGGAGAGPGLI